MNGRTITVTLKAQYAQLRAGLSASSAEVKSFGNDVRDAALSTQQSTDKLGRGFIIAGGVIAGALGVATYAAIQLDQSMHNVATISPYVAKNIDSVSSSLLTMSNALPTSANDLAQGLYDIASSGFAGKEGLDVLQASATAASAGLSDTATAGKAITGVLNAYGLTAKDAANVSDVLFQTVNLGVVTFDELAQNLGDVVGMAATAGVNIKQVGAAIATITLAGVPAAEATTALNRVLQSIITPSDTLIEKFHQWGFASGEAALKALGLSGVMQRIREDTGGNVTAMSNLFPEIRALKGAFALTAADGANYDRVLKQMDLSGKGAGATQRALAEQSKSVGYQLQILKNQVTNLAIGFGQELLPVIRVVAGAAKSVVGTFSDMPGPVRTGVVVLGALSAAMLLVAGGGLLVGSRIGRMRMELAQIGPSGERAVAAIGGLARGIALASGAALAAYGFTALDGSIEGTITGVLSLVSGLALLKPGLAGLQGALQNVSTTLTAKSGLANAGVAVGKVAEGVGRFSQVAPGLAISGAIMASTMDDMGKASVGGAVNMAAMTATGAQLGFVLGGPVGAAIGGTAGLIAGPLMSALGVGAESVDDYRKRFEKLGAELDALGNKQALKHFVDQLGDTDKLSLFSGSVRSITDEVRALAKTSPDAAQRIVKSLQDSAYGAHLTAADFRRLNGVIDEQVTANAKADAQREKSKASNDAIRKAHQEVTAAASQMSEAEQTAAENTQKAMQQVADAATSALPSAKSAFEDIQQGAAEFGVAMDPAVLLQGFKDKLVSELSFGANVTTIMQAGFLQIGNVISQEGPEKGAQVAQALADGIKSGDTTIASQLDDTVKQLTAVPATLNAQFAATWGPALTKDMSDALNQLDPVVLEFLGIHLPQTIYTTIPSVLTASGRAAQALVDPWNAIPVQLVTKAQGAMVATSGAVEGGIPGLFQSGLGVGVATTSGFSAGSSGMGAAGSTAASDAAAGVAGSAGQVGSAGTTAGQEGTSGLASGLSGMPTAATEAVANAGTALVLSAVSLSLLASSMGAVIGGSFSAGLGAGIAAGSGGVQAAARQVISDAESAARTAADSHSPSRLFARVGRDIAHGMALGIRSGTGDAARAAGDLVAVASIARPAHHAPGGYRDVARGGRYVGSSGGFQVFTTIDVGGNIYGDQHLERKMRSAADERDRKLANDLRRRRN